MAHFGPDADKIKASHVGAIRAMGARTVGDTAALDDLHRIMRQPPLGMDLVALQDALVKCEDGSLCSAAELKKGLAKLEYAERIQLEARVKKIKGEMDVLLKVAPLELDVDALAALIEFAEGRVPTEMIDRAMEALETAQGEQEKVRQAKIAAAADHIESLCGGGSWPPVCVMLLDDTKLAAAMTAGEEAGVQQETIDLACSKIREAAGRDAAASRLHYLATAKADGADIDALRAAIKEATGAGVSMTSVQEAQLVLRMAERAQASRHAAAALLEATITASSPLEIEIEHAEAALEEAVATGCEARSIEVATAKLGTARTEQEKLDGIAATMILASVPAAFDVAAVENAVGAAKAAGVSKDLIELVEAKIEHGERRPVTVIKQAAAARANEKRLLLDEAAREAGDALKKAKATLAKARDVAEVALQQAQSAMLEALEWDSKLIKGADGEVSFTRGKSTGLLEGVSEAEVAPRLSAVGKSASSIVLPEVHGLGDIPKPLSTQTLQPREATQEELAESADKSEGSQKSARKSVNLPPPVPTLTPLEGWTNARKRLADAEQHAGAAWAAFEAAVHASELAERHNAKATQLAVWGQKAIDMYGAVNQAEVAKAEIKRAQDAERLKPAMAPSHVQKAAQKGKRRKGGCCGRAALDDVLEIEVVDERHTLPPIPTDGSTPNDLEESNAAPMEGLDGLSWSPLLCARAPNKLTLLTGLALNGAYSNEIVCDAVAAELAAHDGTSLVMAVRELSSALASVPPSKQASLGVVADIWLSKVLLDLLEKPNQDGFASASETVKLVVESSSYVFVRTLRSLLEAHHSYTILGQAVLEELHAETRESRLSRISQVSEARASRVSNVVEVVPEAANTFDMDELLQCIAHLLSSSMHTHESFNAMLPTWLAVDAPDDVRALPYVALAETAHHFAAHLYSGNKKPKDHDNKADERTILAFVGLFVKQPERLTGFQQLVPKVFESHLTKGGALRTKLCEMLTAGGMDSTLVERIGTDDTLVKQAFFWSAPGMKLFGGHPDLKEESKLVVLLEASIAQQPAILVAFLEQMFQKVAAGQPNPDLGLYMKAAIVALSTYIGKVGVVHYSAAPDPAVNRAVGMLLANATLYRDLVYEAVLAGCVQCENSNVLLDAYAANFFRSHLGIESAHVGHRDNGSMNSPGRMSRMSPVSRVSRASHALRVSRAHQAPRHTTRASRASDALERTESDDHWRETSKSERASLSGQGQMGLLRLPSASREELLTPHSKIAGLPPVVEPKRPGNGAKGVTFSALSLDKSGSTSPRSPRHSGAHHSGRFDPAGEADPVRDEQIIMTLANLFVAQPFMLTAFSQLVPQVFESHLKLGTQARTRLNALLLEKSFDDNLEKLLSESDELVSAPFFWHGDIIPLCTKARINHSFPTLNQATLQQGGTELRLYPKLLALLLRLSSGGGADTSEIARRTIEVLDQFERNGDQQQFILKIFNKLDERSRATPEAFSTIQLTVFSEVAANGVQTISSVQGDGLALCEQAMTTLLQSYIAEREPTEWKSLFKDATNIAFMVKYMFREQLQLAKDQFIAFTKDKNNFKKMPNAGEVQKVLQKLVEDTLLSYGEVGIFDPAKLAEIDFLNKPELLVDLVAQSKGRESRVDKEDMLLMTEVTTEWMKFMIEKSFPPLTPHHTQAFIVMMMCRFFSDHLNPDTKVKSKMPLKAFVAQMSTGEGKSIVIAMCAIFMVKLFGLKVHVLENNEGLLERDYATNAPFYAKFGIKSGKDLSEEGVQICYTLKSAINKHFLRGMVSGSLELASTVLIVDEVDDLIVNERPNAHCMHHIESAHIRRASPVPMLSPGAHCCSCLAQTSRWMWRRRPI